MGGWWYTDTGGIMLTVIAIDAANTLGAGWYRIVEHTGADYGVKVVA